MIPFRPASSRPRWFLHALGFGLLLVTSAFLLFILRDGPPNRQEMALIVGVFVITPALIRWQFSWVALYLFMPFVSWLRRVQTVIDPSATIDATDVMLVLPDVLAALALVGFLLTRQLRKKEFVAPGERAYTYPLTFFMLLCLIQVFNPIMGSAVAGANGLRIFVLYMGLFYVTRNLVRSPSYLRTWIVGTAFIGTITGMYGAYQYLVAFPEYDLRWAKTTLAAAQVVGETLRAFSTFSFTSTFSHYMIIAAFTGFMLLFWPSYGRLMQIFAPFLITFSLMGLGFTFVRSAFLGLILATLVVIVVNGEAKHRLRRLVIVLTVGAAMTFVMPSTAGDSQMAEGPRSAGGLVAERLSTLRAPEKESSVGFRLNLWSKTFALATTLYPAGVGIGAGAADRFGGDGTAAAYAYTESQFVSMLAELGWVGFVLFIWLVVYAVVFTIRTYDKTKDPEHRRYLLLSLGWQISMLVTGLTGGPILYTPPGNAYYWAAIGLAFGIARLNDEADRRERELVRQGLEPARP